MLLLSDIDFVADVQALFVTISGGNGREIVDGSGGGQAGYTALRSLSPGLTSAAIPLLLHKHSRVRFAAVAAIRVLIPNGASESIRGFELNIY